MKIEIKNEQERKLMLELITNELDDMLYLKDLNEYCEKYSVLKSWKEELLINEYSIKFEHGKINCYGTIKALTEQEAKEKFLHNNPSIKIISIEQII